MAQSREKEPVRLYSNEVKQLKSWILECQKSHKHCAAQQKGHFFPTRLLDLRKSSIRLVNSHDLKASDGGYAALSYCWGSTIPESGKTTSKTLQTHREGIDYALLPRTLREAIAVTRSLGLPFMWIDALCIIQGDEDNWKRESLTMFQVYSQAAVTIAAGVWDHCDGGFLNSSKVPFINRLKARRTNFARFTDTLEQSLSENPLAFRGWALQERELSTRVIHFTF